MARLAFERYQGERVAMVVVVCCVLSLLKGVVRLSVFDMWLFLQGNTRSNKVGWAELGWYMAWSGLVAMALPCLASPRLSWSLCLSTEGSILLIKSLTSREAF